MPISWQLRQGRGGRKKKLSGDALLAGHAQFSAFGEPNIAGAMMSTDINPAMMSR
jgi:hypothetical protein